MQRNILSIRWKLQTNSWLTTESCKETFWLSTVSCKGTFCCKLNVTKTTQYFNKCCWLKNVLFKTYNKTIFHIKQNIKHLSSIFQKLTKCRFRLLQLFGQIKNLPSRIICVREQTRGAQCVHPIFIPKRI